MREELLDETREFIYDPSLDDSRPAFAGTVRTTPPGCEPAVLEDMMVQCGVPVLYLEESGFHRFTYLTLSKWAQAMRDTITPRVGQ